MPTLTKEQIKQALDKGLTSEQIKNYISSGTTVEPKKNPVVEFGKGVIKGAGRSVLGLVNTVSQNSFGTVGITGFSKKPQPIQTPEILKAQNTAQKVGGYVETAAEVLLPMAGGIAKSGPLLIKNAESIYLKALKPATTLSSAERLELAKTGLKEGLAISQSGVEKMSETIVNLETKLGEVIKKNGAKEIVVSSLKPFVNEAKKFLGETVDVKTSKNAVKEIDSVYNDFVNKYGKTITTENAQVLKTNTYKVLQKYYDKTTAPIIEASKQLARGLKEKILENAPEIGDINKRLTKLYSFENVLEKAASKASNSNIVSLGGKVLATGGGKIGGVLSLVNEIFKPVGKSYLAIGENKIGQMLSKLSPEDIKILKVLVNAGKIGATSLFGKVVQSQNNKNP
jgi:hypothetical protein